MKLSYLVLATSLIVAPLTAQHSGADDATLKKYLSQYAPYEMKYDARGLSPNEKIVLKKLIRASEYLDTLFWVQTSKYGLALRDSIATHPIDDHNRMILTLLNRNAGPFELLNDYATFVGDRKYYPGQEYYPDGMTA